ncbi:MAG: AMP-binding protein [Pseudonocardiaceae bacterium]
MPEQDSPAATTVAALIKLGIRRHDRVLVMLPEGPGLADAFKGVILQDAVPLPINPKLPAHDVPAAATQAGARLILISTDRIDELSDLAADLAMLLQETSQRPWAAALRLR